MASILFLTHKFPDPRDSGIISEYYFIRGLKKRGYEVYLFSISSSNNERLEELSSYCDEIKIVRDFSLYIRILLILHPKNLLHHIRIKYPITLLDIYYHPQIERELNEFIKKKDIDIIFAARPMAIYALSFKNTSKIIHPYDAVSEWHKQVSNVSRNIILKILYSFTSYLTQKYEKTIYSKFDKVLVVTEVDKKLLKQLVPELKVDVLPNGVDTNYFNPNNDASANEDNPSIVFVSSMSGEPTVSNVLWFYNNIFQKIKRKFPCIKLYLVGRDPTPEVRKLEKDTNVIVTGTVDDIRPYVHNASIVVIPMIAGTGIKNKTLEALAMGKPVVTTSIGASGIDGKNGQDFLIVDNPNEFAEQVIELLNDKSLRRKIGANASKLIEEKYSWERITERLDQILKELVRVNQNDITRWKIFNV